MGKVNKVPLPHRQALNATIVYTRRAPNGARQSPAAFLRAMRGALRMSQADLGRRAGVPQSHIARIESGEGDVQLGTLRKLFDAMFCDLLVLPRPRKRPSDALAERELEKPYGRTWAD